MSFSARILRTVTSQGTSISHSVTHTGESRIQMAETIASGSTDLELSVGIDVSQLKMVALSASVDMTVKTNDSGVPDDTITLTAGVPVIFEEGDDALFSLDVTAFFVTNAGDEGVLTMIAIADL